MANVGLLKTDVDLGSRLEGGAIKFFRLSEAEGETFARDVKAQEILFVDLNHLTAENLHFLDRFKEDLSSAVEGGSILVCFSSRPGLHSPDGMRNKYSWIPDFDEGKKIEEDLIDDISVADLSSFVDSFTGICANLYSTCSFPYGFGNPAYELLMMGDKQFPVGFYKALGRGHVFIIPQAEDKEEVALHFIGDIMA